MKSVRFPPELLPRNRTTRYEGLPCEPGRRENAPLGQIVSKLPTADKYQVRGMILGEICHKLEISVATCHLWNKECGVAKMEAIKPLKEV